MALIFDKELTRIPRFLSSSDLTPVATINVLHNLSIWNNLSVCGLGVEIFYIDGDHVGED